MSQSLVAEKSRAFALRCIRLRSWLYEEKYERILSQQLLRSGTSIGANVAEALRGQSRAEFVSKMNIALKEANESEYWIGLLIDSDILPKGSPTVQSLQQDCKELCKMLMSIVRSTRTNDDSMKV